MVSGRVKASSNHDASLNKTQGWRGSVKARHFVMSLKDYYIEKSAEESGSFKGPDGWAIKYINIGRARGILEAFDDDASGFVTIGEANNFTRLRPRDWRYILSSRVCVARPFTHIAVFPTG